MIYNPGDNFIRLPMTNTVNLRDLGGYPAKDGKSTSFHQFLRGGDMSMLAQEEVDFLYHYGLRTVIDLRGEDEAAARPSVFSKEVFNLIHIPFQVGHVESLLYNEGADALFDMYIYILEEYPHLIKQVFSAMAAAPPGGILYHCSAGKDRTGLVSAMILSLVEVHLEDILANYRVSETYYLPFAKKMNSFHTIPRAYLLSGPETMEGSLHWIVENFQTVNNFLITLGNTPEELEIIKEKLLSNH